MRLPIQSSTKTVNENGKKKKILTIINEDGIRESEVKEENIKFKEIQRRLIPMPNSCPGGRCKI